VSEDAFPRDGTRQPLDRGTTKASLFTQLGFHAELTALPILIGDM
jgi:hypothetical protein